MTRAVGLSADAMRRANLSTVLRLLHANGPTTRAALTAETGLNRSTIAVLVGQLRDRELVSESAAASTGTPGRPSPLVSLRTDRVAVLALDIKVDALSVALIGLGGTLLAEERLDRARVVTDMDADLDELEGLARSLLDRMPRRQRLVGIGISVAALTRSRDGMVQIGPNLGWSDVPVADLLRRRLRRRVPIVVVNDADAGAVAERVHGAGRGVGHVVYLSGEVGVGGGIIADGLALAGSHGYAGEVGHMTVSADTGPVCRCGNTGCWELMIGEAALLREAGVDPAAGRQGVELVLERLAAQEPTALAAAATIGRWLGIGLASLANIVDPQRIVLGGLHAQLHPHIAAIATDVLHERSLVASRTRPELVAAAFGPDSPLIGAGELALQWLLDDPCGPLPRGHAVTRDAVNRPTSVATVPSGAD